jgi:hypothetical protein
MSAIIPCPTASKASRLFQSGVSGDVVEVMEIFSAKWAAQVLKNKRGASRKDFSLRLRQSATIAEFLVFSPPD